LSIGIEFSREGAGRAVVAQAFEVADLLATGPKFWKPSVKRAVDGLTAARERG